MVLIWKFRFRIKGSISWNVPKCPSNGVVYHDVRMA
jgi:hypothetical protein